VLDGSRAPEEAMLRFDATQQAGDCCIELKDDAAALDWYSEGLELARQIDDPFEVTVQLGKMAVALTNLKRYDEVLSHYAQARELLVRIGEEEDLQHKIKVHSNLFNVEALPRLIAYNDERTSHTQEALGRDLLRDLPAQLAASAQAVATGRAVPPATSWVVFRELEQAVRSAVVLLSNLLDGTAPSTAWQANSTLDLVGALCRRHYGADVKTPTDLPTAARLLMQVDRSRRAARLVRGVEDTSAGAGPSGGGSGGHVVYLRSFVVSPRLPRFNVPPWGVVDLEDLIACLMDLALVVELGRADIEHFGPGRATTTDADWRRVLRGLAIEAQVLVVIPGPTQGTSWEIEWVATNKFLHKTCFVMPPARAGHEWWWADNWAALRDWSLGLGLTLPEYRSDGCVFRLTSEGLVDTIDFSTIYFSDDLRLTLLTTLLYRSNPSYDFAYAIQQAAEAADAPHPASHADGASATLRELENKPRLELSNWYYDASSIPHSPGVLLLYETPFRLLWAEQTDELHATLARHVAGEPSDFTRAFFRVKLMPSLNAEIEPLLDQRLSIESVVSFRVRQIVSYRFCELTGARERERLLELMWSGASRRGKPRLPRRAAASR
jgi:hypothetical protein